MSEKPAVKLPEFLAYGGDWNPEQWPEHIVDEDIELMREAGVNLVSLGIFSWAKLEPAPGEYDFSWLRQIMDKCAAAGIYVDLATATASPPVWMARLYPQTLPVTSTGVRLEFGSRQQYCPSSPIYREYAQALVDALALEFKDHPALAMWHVNNEYACHIFTCFCDTCAAAFQDWLAAKYGDIEALNHAWNTNFWSQRYQDFAQILPPRAAPTFNNPSQLLDFWRFCDGQILDLYRSEADAIRRHTPQVPVTTNFMGAYLPLNYQEWAKYVDIVADDSYPEPALADSAHEVAFGADLMRSLKGGQPFVLMEQTTGMVQWRGQNATKRPGQFRLWSLSRLARGADGILQFQWRQSPGGAEAFHSAMVAHSGRASRYWPQVVQLGEDLKRLDRVRGGRVEAEVAVVMDWDSMRALHLSVGPTDFDATFTAARQWHRTLWEANVACDIIGVDTDLARYRLIIVPQVAIDYPEFAARLERAAEAGAQVLVTAPTGLVDTTGRAVLGGYLGALRELLGVRVTDLNLLAPQAAAEEKARCATAAHPVTDRITRAVGVPAAQATRQLEVVSEAIRRALENLVQPVATMRTGLWGEYLQLDESTQVEVAAVFADGDLSGEPAITRRRVGSGAAWYVATDLDPIGRAVMVRALAAYARVSLAGAKFADGVEYAKRGEVEFYLNHADKAVELAGVTGWDLLSDKRLTGHVVLAPRSALAVVGQPCK